MPSIWYPDMWPTSSGSIDDEFIGQNTGWNESDFSSVMTYAQTTQGLELTQPTQATFKITGLYKTIPSGNFTVWTKVSLSGKAQTNNFAGGLALWQNAASSSGDIVAIDLYAGATNTVEVYRFSDYQTVHTQLATFTSTTASYPTEVYLRIRRTTGASITYTFDVSANGVRWSRVYTTTSLGVTPLHVGPVIWNNNTGVTIKGTFRFFRYVASDLGLNGLSQGRRVEVLRN